MPTFDRAFALRLRGMGTREGPDGRLLVLTAMLGPDRLPGLAAELQLALTGPGTFQGSGEIGFGATRAIRLTTVGSGYLEQAPDRSFSGVAAWLAATEAAGCPTTGGMVASLITIGAATANRFGHETWLLVPGSLAGCLARDV